MSEENVVRENNFIKNVGQMLLTLWKWFEQEKILNSLLLTSIIIIFAMCIILCNENSLASLVRQTEIFT